LAIALHPRLEADCHRLGQAGDSLLLLSREAGTHWFLLVPETDCLDLLDLAAPAREALLDRAAQLSAFLKGPLGYPRVNVGALGNRVPQLHLHVVGRREGDYCWPGPVWGASATGRTHDEAALDTLRAALETAKVIDCRHQERGTPS
jgi:diadenosine tetraphosphate (Ap4A) HIT family hydrolase